MTHRQNSIRKLMPANNSNNTSFIQALVTTLRSQRITSQKLVTFLVKELHIKIF